MTRGNTAVAYQQAQQEPVLQRRLRYQRRLRLNPMAAYGIALVLIVAVALLYLSQYALLARLNLKIASMEKRIKTLERERRDLERQAAYLASLERIEKVAREELGMIPVEEIRYLAVTEVDLPEETVAFPHQEAEGHAPVTHLASWLRPRTAFAGGTER